MNHEQVKEYMKRASIRGAQRVRLRVPGKCREICYTQPPNYPQAKHRKCRKEHWALRDSFELWEETLFYERYFARGFGCCRS
jgi:hypothetical protein